MSNVDRARNDRASNPKSIKEYLAVTADAIEVGDIMWYDRGIPSAPTTVARPASVTDAWTGSEAGTQGKIAENFLGIAVSAKEANVAGNVRVAGAGVFEMEVDTDVAFEIGDLVCPAKDSGGNYMYDQIVNKLTGGVGIGLGEPSRCIGKVTKRYTSSATKYVNIEILGRMEPAGGIKALLTS